MLKNLILLVLFTFVCSQAYGQIIYQGCAVITPGVNSTLSMSGTVVDGGVTRNSYATTGVPPGCSAGVCAYSISWNISTAVWEIVLNGTNVLYSNSSASAPNPPDLTLGTWVPDAICGPGAPSTLSGDVQPTLVVATCEASSAVTSGLDCNGDSDGQLTASGSGGTIPYTYSWNTGGTAALETGLSAGTYSVTITDASGCTDSASSVLTQPAAIVASGAVTSGITCNGDTDGQLTASGAGGTIPYTYSWNTGGTSALETGLGAGTYSVTITDSNGCTDSASSVLTQPAAVVASGAVTSGITCNGDADGQLTASGSGGTIPYTYSWNTGGTSALETGLGAGTYSVTITDSNGCTDSASSVLAQPAAIVASGAVTSGITCNGDADGQLTASGSGGTIPYTYSWNTGGTSALETGLGAGTYSVTITDSNGCTDSASSVLTQPAAVVASGAVTSGITCNGDADGQLTASGSGGTTPYTYSWNTGGTSALETGLGAGTYSVTITDSNGCTDSASSVLTQPAAIVASGAVTSGITCNGDADGQLTASGSGGTIPYTYSWNTGGTSALETGLGAGTYSVTITDSNGCTDSASSVLTQPAAIVASGAVTSGITCNGDADGQLTANGMGGTMPYTYSWNTGGTSALETGLGAGTYSVTITDSNGCTDSASSVLTQPAAIVASGAVTSGITCNGDADGQLTASGSGGTIPYTYSWNTGGTSALETGLGAGTYSVTITDSNGCTDSASSVLTQPAAIVASGAVTSGITCNGDADGQLTASGMGGTMPYTYSWNTGGTSALETGLGAGTYSVTITDSNGCTDSASSVLTQPAAIVASGAVTSGITCNGDADGQLTASGSGGTTPYTYSWNTGGTSALETGLGAGTYSVTITDSNGCTDSASSVLTQPAAIVASASITSEITCNGAFDGQATASQTGGTAAYTYSWNTGGTAALETGLDVGTYSVTVTDQNGCTDSASVTLMVFDTIAPTAACQDITVHLNGVGTASISANDIDGGSSDNCGSVFLTVDTIATNFTCANVGPNTITLTVNDGNGNMSTCVSTVTVLDTLPPTAACQDITVHLNGSGTASISANDIDGGSSDNCGSVFLTVDTIATNFTCANVGPNTITLTVNDGNGNMSTCVSTVTVLDTLPPTAACQDITVHLNGSGTASISANDIDGGSSDNCGSVFLTVDTIATNFTCANVGPNTITLTVNDGNGNMSTCVSTVTVLDSIAPTAACQDITVYLNGAGTASILANDIDGGSSDNCGSVFLTVDTIATNFTCANVGPNTITLTVNDGNGNMSTCVSTVTVLDSIAPTAACQDITVYLNGAGTASILANDIDGGSSDNCGSVFLTVDTIATNFTCANVGPNTITLTVNDGNGNMSTCVSTVTVLDSIAPTAACQDITVYLNGAGTASILANDIDGGSSDNCGSVFLTVDTIATNFTCTNVGPNIITLTVNDGNGNMSTCVSTVTVLDSIAPTAACQDVTVYLNGAGTASITANDIDGGSVDNCGSVFLTVDTISTNFTCANVGANTITLTVNDGNGNLSTCTSTVTVLDTLPPTAVCQDITVHLNGSGTASITANDIDGGSVDNCGSVFLTVDTIATNFTCANVGPNTITLTVNDGNGNMSTCVSTVTVLDSIAPTAACQDITVYLNGSGTASILANDIDGGSVDNCGSVFLTVDTIATNFTCANVGPNTITLTVNDGNGNMSTCVSTVTVLDSIAPTAACQDITVYLNGSGTASVLANDIDGGSSDNCGSVFLTVDTIATNFTCANVGPNTITLTVNDGNGNMSTCTSTVTVLDTLPPTAVCQDITVHLNGSGTASILANDIDGGSVDNCGSVFLTVDTISTNFTCANVGANTITLTVNDGNGNLSTCTSTVTVLDTLPPTVVCQDITVHLNGSGTASITANDIDGGSVDNCGSVSLTVDTISTNFTCANVGANTITLTVNDGNVNLSTCTSTVTVLDTLPPTAVCQDITIHLDGSGTASITASDVDGGSSDNCGNVNLAIDSTTFDCTKLGANTVVLSVNDGTMTSMCSATVTVIDTLFSGFAVVDSNVTCNAFSDGGATAGASGGTMPYTYAWSNSATTASITGVSAGTYSVTITSSGCSDVATVMITEPVLLGATAVVDSNASCNAFSDGGATASASGGTMPYTYSWSNSATTASITGIVAGTYSVTITDNNGCTDSASSTITEPVLLGATAVVDSNASCNAFSDGGATASASGGTMPYTYSWSNSATTASITGVVAGTYSVTITDNNGCTDSASSTITEPVLLGATAVVDSNTTCNSFSDGGATASASGGTMPYTYSWSNSATTASITGVVAGTYSVTITDNNGCTDSASSTITEPVLLGATAVVDSNASCNAFSDGGATASASGGTMPYTYSWSNSATTASITGVVAGTYSVTITDNNGCTASTISTITQPVLLGAIAVVDSNTTCNSFSDGGATASASGGTMPYTYSWSNSATTASITGVVAGTYSVTITDNNGCTDSASSTITEPVLLGATAVVDSNATCNAFSDGGATASASGGTMPYTYSWSNSTTTASITGVVAGTYSVTITDNNGCTASTISTITEPVLLGVTAVVDSNATCNGFSDGGATASASGGTMPYTYAWNNGATTASVTGVAAGTYSVTITDNNGCTDSASSVLTQPSLITVTFTALTDLCVSAGLQAGQGSGSPSGGVYSGSGVADDGNGMTYSFDPASAGVGVHTITYDYTDGNGCMNSANDNVEVFALPVVMFTALTDLCIDAGVQAGQGGGTLTGGVYSGAGVADDGNGMTYSFDPASAGIGVHSITYTYTDGNGCMNSASDDVEVFALPVVMYAALADLCVDAGVQAGQGGGTLTGGVYSGAGITDDGNGMTYSFDPSGAGVGVHTITYDYTDVNGCMNSASDDVEVFDLPLVSYTALSDLCVDAGVQAALGGGTLTGGVYSGAGITDDGNGMTYSFDPAGAGVGVHTITYTYTDGNGCTDSASDDVEVFDLPTVTFTALADLCIDAGVQSGMGSGVPNGGVYSGAGVTDDGNGMTYSFDPTSAGVGVHTITYTYNDTNGCTGSFSDDVEVFDLPVVMYTALADLCVDAGVQAGQGGGTLTGGVYSGAGITDDGNGMTYSFDPSGAGVGVHTITYDYTDVNGCMNSASDDVEVFDLPLVSYTALSDLCVDAGVQAALGGGTLTGGVYSGAGITDDGNGMTYSFDPAGAGVGVHTITYTYTDGNGCTDSASDDVEVFDLPNVTFTALADLCIDAGVQSGMGSGVPNGGVYSGAGVTDDGNGMTYSFDPASAGVGVHTITYTYNDTNGCTGSFSDDVEVFDLPVVTFTALADVCLNEGVLAGESGGSPTGGVYSGSGVTDDGNGMTYSFDPAAAGVGVQTITYDYTDVNGCMNSASDDVEVFDLPLVSYTALADLCVDAGVQAALGGGTLTGGVYSGVGITDDGNGMTYSFDPAGAGVGIHTITYTYTDGNGCTDSASDDVEVLDLPIVSLVTDPYHCLDADIQNIPMTGGVPVGGVYSGMGITDAGDGINYNFDPTVNGAGTVTVTYSYTDSNGCSNTATSDIDVADCGSTNSFEADDPCACLDNATPFDCDNNTGGDDGQFSEVVTVSGAGGPLPNGMTWSIVGASGALDAFNIPAIGSQSAGVAIPSDGSVQLMYNVQDGIYEVEFVHVDEIGYTLMIEGPFAIGSAANVTLTISNKCEYPDPVYDPTIPSVIRDTDPVITLGGMDTNGNGSDGITYTIDGNPEVTLDPSALSIGNHTVVMTYDGAEDGNGGVSPDGGTTAASPGCVQIVEKAFEIIDCELIVDCSAIRDSMISCREDLPPVDFDLPIIIDSCGNLALSALTIIPGNTGCAGDEIIITRTYFINDGVSPLAECMQTFTIVNTTPPSFTFVSSDTIVQCGTSTDPGTLGSATATGECNNSNVLIAFADVIVPGNCPSELTINRTWTATDVCGNMSDSLQVISVVDTVAPVVSCMSTTIYLDENGMASITVDSLDDGGTTDNCSTFAFSLSQSDFSCEDLGANDIQLIATDACGNIGMCTAVVTVLDSVAPEITCPGNIVVDTDPDTCGAVVMFTDVFATDACSEMLTTTFLQTTFAADNSFAGNMFDIENTGTDPLTIDMFDVNVEDINATETFEIWYTSGSYVGVELDASAWTSMGSSMVSPQGLGLPTPVPVGGLEVLPGETYGIYVLMTSYNNSSTLGYTNGNNLYSDANLSITTGIGRGDGAFTGNIFSPRTWNGNIHYSMGSAGSAVSVTQIDVSGLANGDFFPTGETTLTYQATDNSGNTSTCEFTVTVEDNENPTCSVSDTTIYLDANGEYTLTLGDLNITAEDNCGVVSMTLSSTDFDCDDLGTLGVDLTVVDAAGNESICGFMVTVQDTLAPIAMCQGITVFLDGNGLATITADELDNNSTDNCTSGGDLVFSATQTAFTCSDLDQGTIDGEVVVIMTVTDEQGNSSTCESTVTVIDNMAPIVSCWGDIDITLTDGACGEYVNYNLPIVMDNCPGDYEYELISGPQTGEFLTPDDSPYLVVLRVTNTDRGDFGECEFMITVNGVVDPIESLSCNTNLNISLDGNCQAVINADMILEGGQYQCYEDFVIIINDTDTLFNDMPITEVGTYQVTVYDPESGNSCWGIINVEDKIAPVVDCPCSEPIVALTQLTGFANTDFGSPEFMRPNTFDQGGNCAPTAIADHVYDANPIQVSADGNYTFTTSWVATPTGITNPSIAIYEAPFDPTQPCVNAIASGIGNESADLQAGVDYVVVFYDFQSNQVGGGNYVTDITTTSGGFVFVGDAACNFLCYEIDAIYNSTVMTPNPVADQGSCNDITSVFSDALETVECGTSTITRSWIFTDASGNTSTCQQIFNINNIGISNLSLPPAVVTLGCGADLSPQGVATALDIDTRRTTSLSDDDYTETPNVLENHEGIASAYPHYFITGFDGNLHAQPVDNQVCDIVAIYSDQVLDACDVGCHGNSKVIREWTLVDWCTTEIVNFTQVIKSVDETGPTFDLTEQTVSTRPWDCTADFALLPPNNLHDSCDISPTYYVSGPAGVVISGNATDGYTASGAPKGVHTFTYTAEDCCGNPTSIDVAITVLDQVSPVASSKQDIVVALTPAGPGFESSAKLFTHHVNNFSYDACTDVHIEIRRNAASPMCGNEGAVVNASTGERYNNNVTFNDASPRLHDGDNRNDTDGGQFVKFCCEDLTTSTADVDGDGVMDTAYHEVVMRVWDDANMTGVYGDVDASGHSDNYNEIWAYVLVEDNLPPVISCPVDATISCFWTIDLSTDFGAGFQEASLANFDKTGEAVAYSTCEVEDIEFSDRLNLDDCGVGTITRTWRASKEGKNGPQTSQCIQTITVEAAQSVFNVTPPNGQPFSVGECEFDVANIAANQKPTVEGGICDVIGENVEVAEFLFEDGVCKSWVVTYNYYNWCTGENMGPFDVKYIYEDTEAPTIECEDACYSTDANCEYTLSLSKSAIDTSGCTDAGWLKWHVTVDTWADGTPDYVISTYAVNPSNGRNITSWATNDDLAVRFGLPSTVQWLYVGPTASGGNFTSTSIPEDLGGKYSKHIVTYKVTDGCHNFSSCVETIEVADKKAPTPYCISISSALMEVPVGGTGEPMVELWACDFNVGSFDNCSPQEDLMFTFDNIPFVVDTVVRSGAVFLPVNVDIGHYFNENGFVDFDGDGGLYPVAKASTIAAYNRGELQKWIPETLCAGKVFTCADAPQANVVMSVWDKQLNVDHCDVFVTFGGVVGDCDPTNNRTVAGNVSTMLGSGVKGVEVSIEGLGLEKRVTSTDASGDYAFTNINRTIDASVSPAKDGDDDNGVSTLDLVLIQRHILSINSFDSPYHMIAADINDSETITGADVVELRKLILGVTNEFADNTSWRFVDASQVMDASSVFPYREDRYAPQSDVDQTEINFVGVKIGDVNNSAEVLEGRSSNKIGLLYDNQSVEQGQVTEIVIGSEDYVDAYGYQFTLDLDGLELVDVKSGDLNMSTEHVAVLDNNTVTVSYSSTEAQSGSNLFTLVVKATQSGSIAQMMNVSSEVTRAEAYTKTSGDAIRVSEVSLSARGVEAYDLFQNEPNPFKDQTVIGWNMAEAGVATITVYDVAGRTLSKVTGEYNKGANTMTLNRSDLNNVSGVLYYKLKASEYTATKKMILID